jgi:hypothetical protein
LREKRTGEKRCGPKEKRKKAGVTSAGLLVFAWSEI